MLSNEKIAAIYDLREAVESKVRAEHALNAQPSEDTRMALLDATLDVEDKTQKAIDVCHDCGREHVDGATHNIVSTVDNVITVDFGQPQPSGTEPG